MPEVEGIRGVSLKGGDLRVKRFASARTVQPSFIQPLAELTQGSCWPDCMAEVSLYASGGFYPLFWFNIQPLENGRQVAWNASAFIFSRSTPSPIYTFQVIGESVWQCVSWRTFIDRPNESHQARLWQGTLLF